MPILPTPRRRLNQLAFDDAHAGPLTSSTIPPQKLARPVG
jgi:hypothetical protein